MPVTYQPWLVALSIVMAVQGAYVGLSLAIQVGDAIGVQRRLLLAAAAFLLAVAIWTMHFVGMLAARLPFPVDFLVFPTLLSFLVCVIVVGIAIYVTSSGPLTQIRLTLSSCLMGAGIFSMHYIGMMALHVSAHMVHASTYVAGSLAIAIAASGLALWLAAGRGGRPPLFLSAIAFGIAVSGMHYTAMEGMTLVLHAAPSSTAPALSTDLLAIVVAVVAFCLSGTFLLFLVPDRARVEVQALARTQIAETPAEVACIAAGDGDTAEMGRGSYAPLGGAGRPPARVARHLPVERDGTTKFVSVDDVVAIHANAHYTYIFNGSAKLFCPLAIGEIEARLDKNRFMRIHRSHIINIERMIGHKRSGDSEVVELAAAEYYAVPVSRSRIGWLKSRIRSMADETQSARSSQRHFASQ
jgi:NO-binding membrane sensor protein with MHYT domain